MEILFENKYVRNKEWAKDAFAYIYFRRPIMIVFDIVFGLYAILGIYELIDVGYFNWLYFFIPVFWCVFIAFMYRKNVVTIIKRDQEIHGKEIEVNLTVTEELIKQSQSTGSEFQLNYHDIKRAIKTKKYIYLWSKTNMLYSLKLDSFSVGTADDFLIFLRNKGIKVK